MNIINHAARFITPSVVQGFTLVELLVVMGIVGVLAAGLIALVNPADRLRQANDAKVMADLHQMIRGVQAYTANNQGSFPVGSATNWTAVGTYLTFDNALTVAPSAVNLYSYASNCVAAGPCKLAVSLLSAKNLGGSANAQACWISTSGSVSLIKGTATSTNASCP